MRPLSVVRRTVPFVPDTQAIVLETGARPRNCCSLPVGSICQVRWGNPVTPRTEDGGDRAEVSGVPMTMAAWAIAATVALTNESIGAIVLDLANGKILQDGCLSPFEQSAVQS